MQHIILSHEKLGAIAIMALSFSYQVFHPFDALQLKILIDPLLPQAEI